MKVLSKILYGLFLALLLSVAGLFLATMLPIPGNIAVKIVKSGSMEPTIHTGGIVVIRPSSYYNVGDVITFGEDSPTQIPTTHRIVAVNNENGKAVFVTKGDANEEADTQTTTLSEVEGKVILAVPYVGYILDFARQPLGFSLLIGLPAMMIIFDELAAIWTEVRKIKVSKRTLNTRCAEPVAKTTVLRMMDIRRPTRRKLTVVQEETPIRNREAIASFVIVVPLVIALSFAHIGSTVSYFSDVEISTENTMRASADYSTVVPLIAPLIEPIPLIDEPIVEGEVLGETDDAEAIEKTEGTVEIVIPTLDESIPEEETPAEDIPAETIESVTEGVEESEPEESPEEQSEENPPAGETETETSPALTPETSAE